jgi:hypothetical protein
MAEQAKRDPGTKSRCHRRNKLNHELHKKHEGALPNS